MHQRFFTSFGIFVSILLLGAISFSQTEDMLNNELNAAEGAAGGEFKVAPGPKELKSDGNTLDAIGIPQESGPVPASTVAPAPLVKNKIEKQSPAPIDPPPPLPEPPKLSDESERSTVVPAPEVTEDSPTATPTTEEPLVDGAQSDLDSLTAEPPVSPSPQEKVDESHKICNCRFKPGTPYRERKPTVSGTFAFEGGTYAPTNFISQTNSKQTYSAIYSGSASPNIELAFGAQWNSVIGAVGLQLTGGYFSASNQTSGSTLTVNPITLGLTYSMNNIFKEPYVVPYGVAGVYTDIWKETSQGISANGRTGFAGFYAIGLMFQLDWIDPETHDSGYKDFGLENTFIFVEGRSFLASNDLVNLSSPIQLSGGFKFEF